MWRPIAVSPCGQRVVKIAGEPRALLDSSEPDALLRQPRPLDGDANLRGNRLEEIQLATSQPPPPRRGHVHDPQAAGPEVERKAGVVAQAAGRGAIADHGRAQAAALDDVDVLGRERAGSIGIDAPAAATGHPHGIAEERRQVTRRRIVETSRHRIDQPHPAGFQSQQIGDPSERFTDRLVDVGRAVERLGDVTQDAEVGGSLASARGRGSFPGHSGDCRTRGDRCRFPVLGF